MKQSFTLDRQSFEQFLAAISVFQPLQQAAAKRGSEPLFLSLLETLRGADSGTLTLQDALVRVADLALRVVGGETAGLWLFQGELEKEEAICRAIAGKNIEDTGIVSALLARLESGGAFQDNPPPRLDLTRTLSDRPGAVGSALAVAILPGSRIAGGLAVFSSDATAFHENNYSHLRLLAGLAQYILLTRASRRELLDSPERFRAREIAASPFHAPQAVPFAERGARERFDLDEPRPVIRTSPEISQPDRVTPVPGGWGSGVRDALISAESESVSSVADWAQVIEKVYAVLLRIRDAAQGALPRFYTVRVNWRTFSQGMQALAILAIMSFFVGMLTGSTRSMSMSSLNTTAEAGTQPAGSAFTTAMPAPGTVLASTRSSETPRVTSHRQITDRDTEERVAEMSRFELRTVRRGAEGGDGESALQMGMLYELGQGVPQSCAKAADWVKQAAQNGNAAAEYNLGLRYRDGDGVVTDTAQAESWLRKAAGHKNQAARSTLAEIASAERH